MSEVGKRASGRTLRFAVAAAAWLLICSCTGLGIEDPGYFLVPWPYGAVAWVGEDLAGATEFSAELSQIVQEVFSLWGLPVPEAMAGWEDPAHVEPSWKSGTSGTRPQVLKKDPASGSLWRLTPLAWDGITVYPLLYIAFPTRSLLAQAIGTTMTGGVFILGDYAIRDSQVWFQALTGVPRCIAAPSQDDDCVARHEIAHWMTHLVAERDLVEFWQLPTWIIEGIAEYTEAAFLGLADMKAYAAAWAEANQLEAELGVYDTYRIGLSVVTYLVETHGPAVFLAELGQWAERPEAMIDTIESGWRAWLEVDG